MTRSSRKKQKKGAPWRGVGPKLVLLCASLVAALLLGEVAVRVLGLAPKINRINPEMKKTVYRISDNPVLGYVFKENYRDDDHPDLKASYPYINSHGFRDIERSYRKPKGTKRIILLGDSVVAGAVNIADLEDTISRKLEKLMAAENVEVLNMGINGYCTRAELELLVERGLRYDPDMVILIFCHNDFQNINSDLGMVSQPAAVQFFFTRSHLFRWAAIRFNLFRLRTQFGIQEIAGEWAGELLTKERDKAVEILQSDRKTSETVRKHLSGISDRNVHRSLPELKRLSQEHGFGLLMGIWPLFTGEGIGEVESWGVEQLVPVLETGALEIERLARENQIPHFRFSDYFKTDYLKKKADGAIAGVDPRAYYVGDGNLHVNPAGAQVAAEAIRGILEDHPEFLGPR